jgi:hypothetical protein
MKKFENLNIRFIDARIMSERNGLKDSLTALMSKELCRMSFQIIRIEVHLNYEPNQRDGIQKMFCVLDAHFEGCEPITVTSEASCFTQAACLAITKLKASYIKRFGHIWNN